VCYSLNARGRRWGVGFNERTAHRKRCAGNAIAGQQKHCENKSDQRFHSSLTTRGVKIAPIPVQ
jgi:hypothetical protein